MKIYVTTYKRETYCTLSTVQEHCRKGAERARSQRGPLKSRDHRRLQVGLLFCVCAATDWKDENECHVKMAGEQSVEPK